MIIKKRALFLTMLIGVGLLSLQACVSSTPNSGPVPGNSGIISISEVKSTSLVLHWMHASDDLTPPEQLEYRVYAATSDDIDTMTGVLENATPVDDWVRDENSKNIGALTEKTIYYFTVLVRDEDGNMAAYGVATNGASVSGQLSILTFEGSGEDGGPRPLSEAELPFSNLKLPEEAAAGLRLGERAPSSGMEPEFVPGEIIVRYKSGVEPLAVRTIALGGGFTALREGREIAAGVSSLLRLAEGEMGSLSPAALKDRTLREIDRLNAQSFVEYAQPNYIYRPLADPADNFYNLQWHYPLINWDLVWEDNTVPDVSSVVVAVIDTGIVRHNAVKTGTQHEDFGVISGGGPLASSPFVDEYDFVTNSPSSPNRSRDGDGYDNDASDPGDSSDPGLMSFHGTHVAGTIGAYTSNGSPEIGVAGIAGRSSNATSVQIMPLRALGVGGGTTSDIVQAIKYAARISNSTGALPAAQADVINLSLGSTAGDSALEDAINAAAAKDIVIVAAAGNNSTPTPFYPAAYPNVISVSAVDIGAEIASYSNYGTTIDVAAPGGSFSFDLNRDNYVDGILSTFTEYNPVSQQYATDLYAFYQGTSMAAPHVAGLAALIRAADPSLTAAEIRARIESNAIDLGSAGKDTFYGHGMIDAYAAVNDVQTNGPSLNPVLFPFPRQFKFMGDDPSGSFRLKNIVNSTSITFSAITVASDTASGNWVSVSTTSGTADDTGTDITIDIDTTGYPVLKNGSTHTAELTIQWTSVWGTRNQHVYVLYNVNGFPKSAIFDIGDVYVVAIDAGALESDKVYHYDKTTFGELYSYRIGGLPAGSYIIGASTDHNNDTIIFEDEDMIGFYISIDQVVTVAVDKTRSPGSINFDVVDQASAPTSR